jgi:hypothetical protein
LLELSEVLVEEAAQRAPGNAGPLNAQRLVLHTQGLMAACSPHCLRRLLTHTETLLWLDQAQAVMRQPARPSGQAAKPIRPVRTGLSGRPNS